MRNRTILIVAVLAVVVVSLVPLSGTGVASTRAQKADGPVVKVGFMTPVESEGVSNPQDPDAIKAATKYFNKQGGAGTEHNRIEPVICDTHGDANGEVACARQMADEGVAAVLGDLIFENAAGVTDVLEQAQIPRIGLSASNPADFSSPIAFPVSAGPLGEVVGAAAGLDQAGDKKIALIQVETPTASSVPPLLEPPFAEIGVELLDPILVGTGESDYSTFVADAQREGADAATLLLSEQAAAQFVAATAQLRPGFRLSGLSPSFTIEVLRENKDVTKGMVLANSFPYPTANNVGRFPGLKTYFGAMKAGGISIDELNTASLRIWVAMLGFVRAAADLDAVTNETVLDALGTAQELDMDGLIQPWTPSTPGYGIFTRISNHFVYVMTFDGKNVATKKAPIDIGQYFSS